MMWVLQNPGLFATCFCKRKASHVIGQSFALSAENHSGIPCDFEGGRTYVNLLRFLSARSRGERARPDRRDASAVGLSGCRMFSRGVVSR